MYLYALLPWPFRTGCADSDCEPESCQDSGRAGGVVVSSGSAFDRDLEVMLTVDKLGRAGLMDAGDPRGRELSDALTIVSNDSVEVEASTSVLQPMLGVLALGIECPTR